MQAGLCGGDQGQLHLPRLPLPQRVQSGGGRLHSPRLGEQTCEGEWTVYFDMEIIVIMDHFVDHYFP